MSHPDKSLEIMFVLPFFFIFFVSMAWAILFEIIPFAITKVKKRYVEIDSQYRLWSFDEQEDSEIPWVNLKKSWGIKQYLKLSACVISNLLQLGVFLLLTLISWGLFSGILHSIFDIKLWPHTLI